MVTINGFVLSVLMISTLFNVNDVPPVRHLHPLPSPLQSLFDETESRDTEGRYGAYLSATLAQYGKDIDKSVIFFQKALQQNPDSLHILTRAFYQLLQAGAMEEAGQAAVKLVALAPDTIGRENLVRQVAALYDMIHSSTEQASKRLESWRLKSGDNFIVFLMEAWVAVRAGNQSKALKLLDMAEKTDSYGASIAVEHKAYIYEAFGDLQKAEQAFASLVANDQPASLYPFIQYAASVKRREGVDKAQMLLKGYYKKFNGNRFILREGLRITEGQSPSYDARNPREALSMMFFRLGSDLSKSQSKQAAIIYLKIANYLHSGATDTALLLGRLLEDQKNFLGAAKAYNLVRESDPLFAIAQARRINVLRSTEETEILHLAVDQALSDNPNHLDMVLTKAELLREKGQFEQALAAYDKVIINLEPGAEAGWYPYFGRGIVFDQLGMWERAEADLIYSLSLNKGQPAVQNYLGYSWIDRGIKMEEGRALIEAALAQDPQDGFINDSLGWVHYLMGNYRAAVTYLEKAVALEAGDTTLHDHLGDAYWKVGRKIEARFQWHHALNTDPLEKDKKNLHDKLIYGLEKKSVVAGEQRIG